MPRYRLTIEYDGTPFVGWQIQADGTSVQGALTEAVRRFSGETVTVRGATGAPRRRDELKIDPRFTGAPKALHPPPTAIQRPASASSARAPRGFRQPRRLRTDKCRIRIL